jgi:hypothetical protein
VFTHAAPNLWCRRAQQIGLIHGGSFTPDEVENYRHLVFKNLTYGMKCVVDALKRLLLPLDPAHASAVALLDNPPDIHCGEPSPPEYEAVLAALWLDPTVCQVIERGYELAIIERCACLRPDAQHTALTGSGPASRTSSQPSRGSSQSVIHQARRTSYTHTPRRARLCKLFYI